MARTILIADDSPTIRKIVELTFSDTDIRVESARSGGEALDRLASGRPDLVLADVVMPAPNGYELCRSIKSSERPVPVVLLAGTFEPFDADRARDCGADDHLVKPFESEALRSRVRELLDRPSGSVVVEIESAIDEPVAEPPADAAPVEPEPAAPAPAAGAEPKQELAITAELVEAVAEAVVRRLAPDVLREVARRVVPELASEIIRERIRELEQEELEEETGRS